MDFFINSYIWEKSDTSRQLFLTTSQTSFFLTIISGHGLIDWVAWWMSTVLSISYTFLWKRWRWCYRIVYVNNMIVTGSNIGEIERLCSYVVKEFEMEDMRNLKYFLDIEVSCSTEGLSLLMEVCLRSLN